MYLSLVAINLRKAGTKYVLSKQAKFVLMYLSLVAINLRKAGTKSTKKIDI